MFLTLFIVSLVASHFYTSWKLHEARDELLKLRNELGHLTIVDPTRLNIISVPTEEDGKRRWRVYVPKGARYTLSAVTQEIPAKGRPSGKQSRISTPPPEGEFTLTVRTEGNEKAGWRLSVSTGHGKASLGIADDHAGWLKGIGGGGECAARAGGQGTETFARGQSFDLLRQHQWTPDRSGAFTSPGPKPSDGVLIWVDAY